MVYLSFLMCPVKQFYISSYQECCLDHEYKTLINVPLWFRLHRCSESILQDLSLYVITVDQKHSSGLHSLFSYSISFFLSPTNKLLPLFSGQRLFITGEDVHRHRRTGGKWTESAVLVGGPVWRGREGAAGLTRVSPTRTEVSPCDLLGVEIFRTGETDALTPEEKGAWGSNTAAVPSSSADVSSSHDYYELECQTFRPDSASKRLSFPFGRQSDLEENKYLESWNTRCFQTETAEFRAQIIKSHVEHKKSKKTWLWTNKANEL